MAFARSTDVDALDAGIRAIGDANALRAAASDAWLPAFMRDPEMATRADHPVAVALTIAGGRAILASVSSDLPPLPDPRVGRYRHYKGGEYEVVGVARHSESLEPMILYRPLYGAATLWVRPYAMFFELVDIDGRVQPRFAPMAAGSRSPD